MVISDILDSDSEANEDSNIGPTQTTVMRNTQPEPIFDAQAANLAALALYDERDLFLGRTYSFQLVSHRIFHHHLWIGNIENV